MSASEKASPGPREKVWRLFFALLCLSLAARDLLGPRVDPTVIGLIALATAPWSLPWVANLMQSLKVGGVEFNFRQQIEQKIAALDNQGKEVAAKVDEHAEAFAAALSSGIGRPREVAPGNLEIPEAVSHSVAAAPDRGESVSPAAGPRSSDSLPSDPEDPNKNQFGGRPVAKSRKLFAVVKTFPGSNDLFVITASVVSTDTTKPLTDDTPVTFYLHDTFAQKENRKLTKCGTATVECVSSGAFTMGAKVQEEEDILLELDLAKDVPGAPVAFTSR